MPAGWRATLLAVDGSVISQVAGQLDSLPADTTHLVVSAGDNDTLLQGGFLQEPARSVAEVFGRLARDLPTTLCTIYCPCFADAQVQKITVAGLMPFNGCILRAAFKAGLPIIDLGLVCASPADYATEIEPSAAGGAKIVAAIARVLTEHDFARRRTAVFV